LATGDTPSACWSRPSANGTSCSAGIFFRRQLPKREAQTGALTVSFDSPASIRAGVRLSKVAADFQRELQDGFANAASRMSLRPQHWEVIWRSGSRRLLPFRSSAPYFATKDGKLAIKLQIGEKRMAQ